jgi:hypothetical protein
LAVLQADFNRALAHAASVEEQYAQLESKV